AGSAAATGSSLGGGWRACSLDITCRASSLATTGGASSAATTGRASLVVTTDGTFSVATTDGPAAGSTSALAATLSAGLLTIGALASWMRGESKPPAIPQTRVTTPHNAANAARPCGLIVFAPLSCPEAQHRETGCVLMNLAGWFAQTVAAQGEKRRGLYFFKMCFPKATSPRNTGPAPTPLPQPPPPLRPHT